MNLRGILFLCLILISISGIYAEEVPPQNVNSTTSNAVTPNSSSKETATNQTKNTTISSIISASSAVKTQIDTKKEITPTVKVSMENVSSSDYLYLMVKSLSTNPHGFTGTVTYTSKQAATNSQGDKLTGQLVLSEYLKLAQDITSYMDTQGKAPDYMSTSRGKIKYEALIYIYSRVLNFKATQKKLPNFVYMDPINQVKTAPVAETKPVNTTPVTNQSTAKPTATLNDIRSASASLVSFMDKNKKLPGTVMVGGKQLSIDQYLYLLSKGLVQIKNGGTGSIAYGTYNSATNSHGVKLSGNLLQSEVIKLAQQVTTYMDTHGKSPDNIQTSKGAMQYEAIFHVFGRVMSYQNTYKKLPNYVRLDVLSNVVPLKTLNSTKPAENTTNPVNNTSVFLKATKNCQVNDPTIIAMANQLTLGLNSTWEKAEAIFNWVRNNLTYSFYYNTKYGAVNTLKNKNGNCVDHSHLLIALTRAAGIESRYAHGTCQFKSGSVYGHVWAELFIDGKWVKADATSLSNNLGVINNWNTANVVMKGVYSELSF